MIQETTLCFIFNEDRQCLMLRRLKEPHQGQWNAPGGKLQPGETPEEACRREVREETGLVLDKVRALGSVDCIDLADVDNTWCLHLFSAEHARVHVPRGVEGEFAWLDLASVLAGGAEVVHNIPLILPLLLRGVWIRGVFAYRGEFLERYNISLTDGGRGLQI